MANEELTDKDIARKNLEYTLFQNIFASNNYQNDVQNGLGIDKWLQGAYDESKSSPNFVKQREEQYQLMKRKYKKEGIYEAPSIPSDGDVVEDIIKTVRGSLEMITLSDLYGVMASIDPDVKEYKLPEYGGEFSTADISKQAKEQGAIVEKDGKKSIDMEKLSPELQETLIALEDLKKMYEESCKERLRNERRKRYFKIAGEERHKSFHKEETA